MNKPMVGVIILVLVVLGSGVFALTRGNNQPEKTTQTPPPATTSEPPAPTPPNSSQAEGNEPQITQIAYTGTGFIPSSIKVKSGGSVQVVNDTSSRLEFASDPHPAHTENSELNIGSLGAGESKTFTVTKTGSFGFHNHLRPGDTGSLTVK